MEGSTTKGLKSLELYDSDADIRKSSIVSRMYVEGYSTSLTGHDLVMCMRKHFASCGEVVHVYIPGYSEFATLNSFALIYLRGEGAEEKALELSGSYSSRGDKLVVESYPFHAKHLDHKFAPTRDADNKEELTMSFKGYDTWLPLDRVERMLYQELAKCGRVLYIDLDQGEENEAVLNRVALVTAEGIDTAEKLLQICGSDVKGLENIKTTGVVAPEPDGASACNLPPWFLALSPSRTTSVMAATAPEDPNLPKPPCLSTLLPYPVDPCIWNTKTGFGQYVKEIPPSSSAPASRVRYAPEDPNLPKPWIGLVDISTGYGYFWNTETGATQYQRPPSN